VTGVSGVQGCVCVAGKGGEGASQGGDRSVLFQVFCAFALCR
jgi:hypothetical protein